MSRHETERRGIAAEGPQARARNDLRLRWVRDGSALEPPLRAVLRRQPEA